VVGEGWKEKLSDPTDQHSEPPNKKMIVKVRLSNLDPGIGIGIGIVGMRNPKTS
jgi:hypothetical protein